jgi:hypothetical protein
MPCTSPSGMVITNIAMVNVMSVVCYAASGSLYTFTVNSDGSLTALGSVGGLAYPFPGIVLDGTNVFVPLFGASYSVNGAVAE